MSRNYKIHDPQGIYFITYTVVSWIDIFTRPLYKDILLDSFRYCQESMGLEIHAWCIMTNHVHLIVSTKGKKLSDIIRDMKKFISKKIIYEMNYNPQESRKEWMRAIFQNAGAYNSNNEVYQFWQQNNNPIELYSPDVVRQKLDYILNNPVVEGFVTESIYYPYSSAFDYAGGNGPIKIALLL